MIDAVGFRVEERPLANTLVSLPFKDIVRKSKRRPRVDLPTKNIPHLNRITAWLCPVVTVFGLS